MRLYRLRYLLKARKSPDGAPASINYSPTVSTTRKDVGCQFITGMSPLFGGCRLPLGRFLLTCRRAAVDERIDIECL